MKRFISNFDEDRRLRLFSPDPRHRRQNPKLTGGLLVDEDLIAVVHLDQNHRVRLGVLIIRRGRGTHINPLLLQEGRRDDEEDEQDEDDIQHRRHIDVSVIASAFDFSTHGLVHLQLVCEFMDLLFGHALDLVGEKQSGQGSDHARHGRDGGSSHPRRHGASIG